MNCRKCNRKIPWTGAFFSFICESCSEKEKKEKNAKKFLREKSISIRDEDIVSIEVSQTSLSGKIPKKYLEWGTNLVIKGKAKVQDTKEEVPIGKYLIDKVIEYDFDEEELREFIESFFEKQLVALEMNKIKERKERLNIREMAEKELYGKTNAKKRVFLTDEEKEAIIDKFHGECAACGATEGLHIHHKDENPSNNQIKNLSVLCGVCHKKFHMKVR